MSCSGSEAHATVSLRGGQLVLLALRGTLQRGREDGLQRVRLAIGQQIGLVPGVTLRVVALAVPDSVPVLVEHGVAVPLLASVYSVPGEGGVRAGFERGAAAWLWASGDGWRLRRRDEPAEALGAEVTVGSRVMAVEWRAVERVGAGATVASASPPALRLVMRFETAHVHVEGGASLRISWIAARMLTELAAYDAPVPWEMVARTIWADADVFTLRRNWDRHLALLRQRLRRAGVRDDVVRPDGRGNVELFLRPGDEVVDGG
ncbi:MAG: hypothetical protein ACI8PZ_001424 [Myxococcota bacterium]|jgi:hypothetical protein